VHTLRARWVVPVDRAAIANGYVIVADGRIAEIGAATSYHGIVEDIGEVILAPGLVNAHAHLEFSDLRAPLGERGTGVPDWIRRVIAERKRANHDAAAAIAAGIAESAAAGVTTIGEICTAPAEAYVTMTRSPAMVAFQEAIGFSTQRVDSVLANVERRLLAAQSPAGLSPHAPYSVHPTLLDRIIGLATARGVPVAMHLAESLDELRLMANGDGMFRVLLEERSMWDPVAIPPNSRTLDYLRRLAQAPRALVIHGNYLDADEIEFMGQRRDSMSVVYCPRTHDYFAHPPYPLAAMRKAGVRVALGTDSRASNPDLDLLRDVRFAAARFPRIAPNDLLRMATIDAAEALGLGEMVGSLTLGKRADMVALSYPAGVDPVEAIVRGDALVQRVWIGGEAII
jgi:cytosine/adenosine deaminase-related metal-dependent hydrolase